MSAAPTPPDGVLTRPRRLRPGDRVAVVAPSSPVPPARLEAALAALRDWGLDPVVTPRATAGHATHDHLAAPDEDRARDFQDAWCDPSIAAVIAARGGYGVQRMVDLLDWEALRRAGPKLFVGYSDLTVLHEALANRLGLVTVHGPMPATKAFLADGPTRDHLYRTLFHPETVGPITSPTARPLVPGRAHGRTLGGCLRLLAAELGTPGARASAAGGILLLEDTEEEPYSIDRDLTQLLRAGWLDQVAGIALGSWHACGPYQPVREVLRERLAPLGVPVVEELGFGHGPRSWTVPLGVPAVLDAEAGTLRYDLPALL